MTAIITQSDQHVITIPSLAEQGIRFSAESLVPWMPPGASYAAVEQYIIRVQAMLWAARDALARQAKPWTPKPAQLKLALIALTSAGVDLNPTANECCLLSFWDRDAEAHNVTPYVMRDGYRRIASDLWPVLDDRAVIAFEGDTWEYEDSETGTRWRHIEGTERRTRAESVQALSQLIIGAGARITFDGRPVHVHVVPARRLREKIAANKNIGRSDVWRGSPLAMLEKMVLIEAYKTLPLRGRPAAALRLAQMAEDRQLGAVHEHLRNDARARGLPAAACDELDEIDIEGEEIAETSHDDAGDSFVFEAGE